MDENPENEISVDPLEELVNAIGKVRLWAQENEIELCATTASQEAVSFVKRIQHDPMYVMYMDLSSYGSDVARKLTIERYLQAMRTSVSRMRKAIKETHTNRRLKRFSLKLHTIEEMKDCPGLFRVVIDSRADDNRSQAKALIDDVLYEALTGETERSRQMPTAEEQHMALKAKGIVQ